MESITFYDGQTKELTTAGTVWQKLFDTYKKLVWVTVPVATVANMWTVLGGFVTFAIYVLQLAIYGFPAEFSATVVRLPYRQYCWRLVSSHVLVCDGSYSLKSLFLAS